MQKIKASELPKIIKQVNKEPRHKHPHGSVKRGFREDLGIFVASSWEANFARYLNFLLERDPTICDWQYEPDTFEFPIKHGITRYTPDFKVYYLGSIVYYEVKGWMNAPSKTKLNRMRKYYPDVKLFVIDREQYTAIGKWRHLIPGWESDGVFKD